MSSNPSTTAAAQNAPPAAAHADDVDDLDDLDDVLDEFNQPSGSASAQKPAASATTATTTAPAAGTKETATDSATSNNAEAGDDDAGLDDMLSEDFAKELAQGMQALMKELGGQANTDGQGMMDGASAGANAKPAGQEFNEQELMKQFEAMMAGFGGGAPSSSDAGPSTRSNAATTATPAAATGSGPSKPANFNDAIAATMAKLKESDASATADSASSDNPFAGLSGAEGEEMAKLLAALGGSGDLSGLEGAMDNPDLTKMLEGMMDELMSRDILYEPLKELRDKYPAYLAGPESASISAEDRKRYEQQSKYINEIVQIFDEPGYDAKDKQKAARVQELMNQMQDCGSPPQEIVGDMPAELENLPGFGGAGAGNEECTIM
ncbi:hypothetical protein EX895_002717 [Sporisorium graminicola]|uniref:Uncharacterized protein n=1 Tax=Sporisorium graminicola TaxID=280036 RepID=A0A4U7KUP3_9BASI|nr:hypothetical protein EX895_002717 [Sporisorium graminicola]TKY88365.1 hypothetical protein EX895_002717 [Sporisorium graminicola]